jgi:3-hydroxybutyryl-CoA dehydratase
VRARRAVQIDQDLPIRRIGPITQTDIVRFAGAGGDFNPLHHDPLVAQDAGFASVIAMGQMQAGMLAGFVSDFFGVENLRSFEVKFTAPVQLGDFLDFVGRVSTTDGSSAEIELTVIARGVPVITGLAAVAVDPAPVETSNG